MTPDQREPARIARAHRCHRAALASMDELLAVAADPAAMTAGAPSVSTWPVGLHLEHLSLADGQLVAGLEKIARGELEVRAGQGINWLGRLALASGWLPRGVAKAPDGLWPSGRPAAEVRQALAGVRERLADLAPHLAALALSRVRLRHPVFGRLDAIEWMRFLPIHNHHHLKTVRAIRRAGRAL